MFEGRTTIKFSKEAAMLMVSKNLSDMFNMPLEVTAMDYLYDGLEVKFGPPKEPEPEPEPEILPEREVEPDEVANEAASEVQAAT